MRTLTQIFEHARRQPQKTALVHDGVALSYAEFARRIAATRQHLDAWQPPTHGVAVIVAGRLVDDWILLFALRSLGLRTVVARDTRDIHTLDLPDIVCVLFSAAEGPDAPSHPGAAVPWRSLHVPRHVLDAAEGLALAPVSLIPAPAAGHIVRTSGTTGTYKNVLRDVTSEDGGLDRLAQVYMLSAASVVYAADFPVWTAGGYRWPLSLWALGGTVVLQSATDLLRPLAEYDISHMMMTPDKLLGLLRTPGAAPRRNPAMRLMVTGGALSLALLTEAQRALTTQIYSLLGSTEASIFAVTPLNRAQDLLSHRILPSREVQVVDERDQPLGPGLQGRLRARITDGLRGYVGDAAATQEHFRDDWFYPGDLGAFGADGRLSLHGRATDVINVLGNKIATGPLEAALCDRLQVGAVCLLVIPEASTEDELLLVIETPQPLPLAAIEAAVNTELAGLRPLPVRVQFSTALPRNEMGKVQRPLLRQQLIASMAGQDARRTTG